MTPKKRLSKGMIAIIVAVSLGLVGAGAAVYLVWGERAKHLIEIAPIEPVEFKEWTLVLSDDGRLNLWTLQDHVKVLDEADDTWLPLACEGDVLDEIRQIEAGSFKSPGPSGLRYLSVRPMDLSLLGYAENRANLKSSAAPIPSASRMPELKFDSATQRSQKDFIVGFSRTAIYTTSAFRDCVQASGAPGHKYSWTEGMLVGALAIVGVNEVKARMDVRTGKLAGITLDVNSMSTRYVQYGKSKNLKLKDVMVHLKAGQVDQAQAAAVFEASIERMAVIGAKTTSHTH